jgi:predicted small metal-binding protein
MCSWKGTSDCDVANHLQTVHEAESIRGDIKNHFIHSMVSE